MASYEQPYGLNLKPQREQTSWSQTLITGPPPKWLSFPSLIIKGAGKSKRIPLVCSKVITNLASLFFFFFLENLILVNGKVKTENFNEFAST